ncbi:uncharacterized protein PAC_01057 [Phialocephala subalpina]|uniref:BTB domain-containing protein n=1 Tax=Phialocephala subalpina TaxID=576137 RepID=A0A1L7WEH0_9HELO|nr:uncharacterized protein PAC_01057 [Phialocephala subalpina]
MTDNELKRKRIAVEMAPRKKHQKDKPTFSDPTALVTFVIGPSDNSTTFLVHKEPVFNKSEVFAAAFSSNFTEGQTQTFKIEDTTKAAFRFLAELESGKSLTDAEWDIVFAEDQALAETWVLADKFCLPTLQNLVIDYMSNIAAQRLSARTRIFKYVYEHTAKNSALRRFCILSVATYHNQASFKRAWARFPQKMLIEFGAFMLDRAGDVIDEEMCYAYTLKAWDGSQWELGSHLVR